MNNVKFEDNSMECIDALDSAVLAFLEEAAGELEAQAKRNTREDTSQTKNNWSHVVDESAQKATVGNPLENALWEEFGTGEYAINGDGRKGAWYIPVEKVTGHKKPTFNGKVTIVYGKNGKKYYMTNGKKPSRALQKAFDSRKSTIIQKAEKILKEKMK